jgi:hypothetical protein
VLFLSNDSAASAGHERHRLVISSLQLGAQLKAAIERDVFKHTANDRIGMVLQGVGAILPYGESSRVQPRGQGRSRLECGDPLPIGIGRLDLNSRPHCLELRMVLTTLASRVLITNRLLGFIGASR